MTFNRHTSYVIRIKLPFSLRDLLLFALHKLDIENLSAKRMTQNENLLTCELAF